jgi:hypothetical protein
MSNALILSTRILIRYGFTQMTLPGYESSLNYMTMKKHDWKAQDFDYSGDDEGTAFCRNMNMKHDAICQNRRNSPDNLLTAYL